MEDRHKFTDNDFWTLQTYMLQDVDEWIQKTSYEVSNALSIDNSPTLDPLIMSRWPMIYIQRAIYPEFDAQNLFEFADSYFDLVYSHQVLEHIPKPWNAAKEIVRILKRGGIGIYTSCAFNPRHGLPEFNDYYRFLPDGLAELFDGVKVIVKRGWGNRQALLYNLAIDDGYGPLGGRRFSQFIGQQNDAQYPWHTWVIFLKT
jgi:SAM-dependent methyltransferase